MANSAVIGAGADGGSAGAVWIFTRSSAVWSQQGSKLIGAGESGPAAFGQSVSLSSDGNTALVGGSGDSGGVGAAWVLTRSGAAWSQQELTGAGETGPGAFGKSVSLSADGNTALIGAWQDNSGAGAAWVFTRSGASWSQQKLIGAGESGSGELGYSVALSADANTALVGAVGDNGGVGAAFVFIRSGATWSQQGTKLIGDCSGVCGGPNGSGEVGGGEFGVGVALSRDATTALVGAQVDSSFVGAAWVFTQPATCTDVGASTPAGGGAASVSLSCSGPPGVSLTYAIVTPPAHGALRPIDQSTGAVTYISQPGYTGTDTFTYDASDTVGAANLATATITIPPLPPTCKNVRSRTRPGGGAARVALSCTAAAGVPFSYTDCFASVARDSKRDRSAHSLARVSLTPGISRHRSLQLSSDRLRRRVEHGHSNDHRAKAAWDARVRASRLDVRSAPNLLQGIVDDRIGPAHQNECRHRLQSTQMPVQTTQDHRRSLGLQAKTSALPPSTRRSDANARPDIPLSRLAPPSRRRAHGQLREDRLRREGLHLPRALRKATDVAGDVSCPRVAQARPRLLTVGEPPPRASARSGLASARAAARRPAQPLPGVLDGNGRRV